MHLRHGTYLQDQICGNRLQRIGAASRSHGRLSAYSGCGGYEHLWHLRKPCENPAGNQTDAADGVINLQDKLGWYEQNRLPIYEAKWSVIRSILQEVPSSEKLEAYLTSVGLDIRSFETTYGQKKIQNAIWYAKDLKDRYSVLWMYYDLMK